MIYASILVFYLIFATVSGEIPQGGEDNLECVLPGPGPRLHRPPSLGDDQVLGGEPHGGAGQARDGATTRERDLK